MTRLGRFPKLPNNQRRRVVITGLGLVSPFGVGVETAWQAIVHGNCAISEIKHFDTSKMGCSIAAQVPRGVGNHLFNAKDWTQPANERSQSVDFISFAMSAATQALQDAKWSVKSGEDACLAGVAFGSGIGNLEEIVSTGIALTDTGPRKVSPFFTPRILVNLAAGHISIQHGLKGPNHSCSTACATGAHSIGDAYRFIRNGDADMMVAGGSEAAINPLSIAGFSRAKALTTKYNEKPTESSRPFDVDRCGFVMGEGAGALVLEEYEQAVSRGAKIYAEIRGYGLSGDAHHITAPRSNGEGASRAMKAALKESGLQPHHIDYINAHATSTPLGDLAETIAIRNTFGSHKVKVSSTKGAIGHLLGAAGAVESIFAIKALHHDIIPPTLNLHQSDSEHPIDLVALETKKSKVNAVLNNSFGFGGTNACLCFTTVESD